MDRALPFDLDHGTDALSPPDGFAAALAASGVAASPALITQLGRYLACLARANEHMNLTAIRSSEEAWSRHVLDALTLSPALPSGARTLIDVGSGGGVPGVPLAIAHPGVRVTLLEATQKKAAFLSEVARALGLANVTVVASRAEEAAAGPLARSFDVVVARAVARLPTLVEWTHAFGAEGARWLFIKGAQAEAELAEARPMLKRRRLRVLGTRATPTGTIVELAREPRR